MARVMVRKSFGRSLGNMIDVVFGAKEEVVWLEITKEAEGAYSVSCFDTDMALGFVDLDLDVSDEDRGDAPILGISERVRWEDVVITPTKIYAPSMSQIKRALRRIKVCFWDPNDL